MRSGHAVSSLSNAEPNPPMDTPKAERYLATYNAMMTLLTSGSLVRLDLGNFESGDAVNAGLHCGYEDGALVIGIGKFIDDTAVIFQQTIDVDVARELAAVITAWADWCEKQHDAPPAREEDHP